MATFLSKTFMYFFIAAGAVSGSCVYELFFGTGLSHPIWNEQFNWFPIIVQMAVLSMVAGALHTTYLYYRDQTDITARTGGMDYGV